MDHADKAQAGERARQPAAEPADVRIPGAKIAIDHRPAAAAQRALNAMIRQSPRAAARREVSASIDGSPYVVARRNEFRSLVGGSAQLRAGSERDQPWTKRPAVADTLAGGQLNLAGAIQANAVVQRRWVYDQLLTHDKVGLLGPAIDVFTSGVKFTEGPGVALYRLATRQADKLTIEFRAIEGDSEVGGDTQLLFMDNTSLSGLSKISGNMVVMPNIKDRAASEGLKIRININPDAKMNSTTGGIVNTLVHEFAVHAVEYYEILKGLLEPVAHDDADKALGALGAREGIGEPPVEKAIMNALIGGHSVETKGARAEHKILGSGGTPYYKALVARIADKELNTTYHRRWKNNRNDFMEAQSQDVKGHDLLYNPKVIQDIIEKKLNEGISISELSSRVDDLLLQSSKFFDKK